MGKLGKDIVWALVFDGGKARLFRRQSASVGEAPLVELETRELENPRAHEQGRDKPGRAHAPTGGGRLWKLATLMKKPKRASLRA